MTYITDRVTLYISSNEVELKKRGDAFLIYENNEKTNSIPAIKIKDIVIAGNIVFNNEILSLCKKEKINLHYITKSGKYNGSMVFDPPQNIFIRIAQFKKHFCEEKSLEISKKLINAKINNQKWMIDSFKTDLTFKIPDTAMVKEYQELLGIEGSKSKEYFSHFGKFIKNNDFSFIKRTKNPPEDEINALLSLSYTLLTNEIHTLCNIVSLDPYIGFLHKNYYGRPSLVCDLVEPYRPFIDKFVITLINRKEITIKDFQKNSNKIEYELNKEGFSLLIQKWTEFFKKKNFYYGILGKEVPLNKLIENDIRLFAKYLIEEVEDFTPYKMR